MEIFFAHHSFKWANSAARNAAVSCVIVGIAPRDVGQAKVLFDGSFSRAVANINAYLVDGPDIYVESRPSPMSEQLPSMLTGSVPNDGGNLILSREDIGLLETRGHRLDDLIHRFFGSEDYLQGGVRSCLVIGDGEVDAARAVPEIAARLDRVAALRATSKKKETREQLASVPHRFQYRGQIPY